ncbi:MAG: CAP domain-containing protein [Steroidobacteraceae bacterium]
MRALVAILLAIFELTASHGAASSPDLLATINGLRAKGCARHRAVDSPLRADPLLDRVAQAMMSGKRLAEAMKTADYRALRSSSLEVSGGGEGVARTLARRGCEKITDPDFRDVGIAERPNEAWIVLAAPVVLPAPGDADSVSRQVLGLVNEARARPRRCGGTPFDAAAPLLPSNALQRIALTHARDMAGRSSLSHVGHDGSTPAERATRAGYRWRAVGENIAAGQTTAEQVVADWVKSARHCANLMDADFTEMGVAYAVEARSSAGIYWAQMFGTPRG